MNYYFNNSSDLFPNVVPQNKLESFVQFPLIRLIIAVILLIPGALIVLYVREIVNDNFDKTIALYLGYLLDVILIAVLVYTYRIYTRYVENRPAYEFSTHKLLPEFGAGSILGVSGILIFVSVNSLFGFYKIAEINSFGNVVHMFFEQLKVGFVEELLFRVILFKLTEEFLGSWAAIAVQGALFGFAHSGNPNATIETTIALIFAFTIFFGGAYMITRRIWFIFAFHWSWNFFQAGVFGIHNSGHVQPSLITPTIEGPDWITGGEWGAELSVISVILLFTVSLYFIKLAINNNQFVKPRWRR